jgi:hypothetical protein
MCMSPQRSHLSTRQCTQRAVFSVQSSRGPATIAAQAMKANHFLAFGQMRSFWDFWGGHEFWPTPAWSFYGASKHNGLGQYSYFGSSPVDVSLGTTPTTQNDVALVTEFDGYWGAPQPLNKPPEGPPLHCQWFWDPSTTSMQLLASVQNSQWTDPNAVQSGALLDGKCGGKRQF